MRIHATVTFAALTLAGCYPHPTAVEGGPPVRHVAISRLPEQPAHHDEVPVAQPPGPLDRSDPVAVAVALIVTGLAEEGLEVVDLGTETLAAKPAVATVRVAASHRQQGGATPHTSVYELDLSRDPGGSWRRVGFRQAH